MKKQLFASLLGLVTPSLGAMFDPYYGNMSWEAPRTLSNWSNLTVSTPTGSFIGMLNDTYPNVRQFLRVPFAQPPVGDLRWMPPKHPKKSNKKIDSTKFGPSCPQFVSGESSLWNEYQPANLVINIGEPLNAGATAWGSAEDCLTLAIWTPSYANKTSRLPVALFVTGGGGVTGGINIASQLPSDWVARSQEHIVVTINYRANIFGNPKSRALDETSLSLLDVRAAVEWVSENIELFGGDKDNIMLWGQSMGAALTHLYTLAWPKKPLVHKFGIISQPPGARLNLTEVSDPYADFDAVAKTLGCNYGDDAVAELECMRHVSFVQITETINNWNATPSIEFSLYLPDEKYIFSNETDRYVTGKVANGPAITSNTATEIPVEGNLTLSILYSQLWTCLNYEDSVLRQSLGLDTYRYFWAGNFSNISPVPWLGAFHWSDLFMIFGTYRLDVGGKVPQLEVDTSETMQDYLLAFLKDSLNMETTVSWPKFDAKATGGGAILEFGKDVAVQTVSGDYVDGVCWNSSASFPYFS